MQPKTDPSQVFMAAPIMRPMLASKRDAAVQQILHTYRDDRTSDRDLRDRVAELAVIDILQSAFEQEYNAALEATSPKQKTP